MSDGDGLLRAVCEAPWDDTPRLVYADWLEEHGDADRAAYIRFEIGLARHFAAGGVLTPELGARRVHFWGLFPMLRPNYPAPPGVRWGGQADRGFPCQVTVTSATAFLKHAEHIYQHAPVTSLKVRNFSARSIYDLTASSYLARLTVFDVSSCWLHNDGIAILVRSPHLTRLETLIVSRVGMTDAGVELIAAAPLMRGLRHLHIDGNAVSDEAAEVIARSAGPRLQYVNTGSTHMTRAGNDRLAVALAPNKRAVPPSE